MGFPIDKSFFESKNAEALKKEFDIPLNKPVLMVLMGGIGFKTFRADKEN